ncbi:MAG: PLP-dependent aminotransferase family protein [Propionibacteriaceae bacterium]|nr:PLP-dependent aminotransferase family protein [Propionibacteriaceae bacterium]
MPFTFPVSSRFGPQPADPVGDLFSVLSRGDIISFAGGIPDGALFAFDDLRSSFEHVLAHQARRALQYGATPGEPELREAAAALVARDLPTTPDQIQVTSGSQEGIYLAAQALLSPGDVVLVEEPTYLAAVQAFMLGGARLVGVEADAEGMLPDALASAIAEHGAKVVYLIPTFANPSGKTMGRQRREQIAAVLLGTDVALIEDDPYGRLRFSGEPVAPIAALPGMAERTILLNSMSKVMAPGLRIGWMRVEGALRQILGIAKSAVTLQSPALNQLAVAHYLTHHDLDAHIASVVGPYRERRDALHAGLMAMLPATASVTRPDGGMFCWVRLGDDTDTAQLLPIAVEEGVAFVPGWSFYAADPDRSTMRLSYATNSPEMIAEGLRRLASALGR